LDPRNFRNSARDWGNRSGFKDAMNEKSEPEEDTAKKKDSEKEREQVTK
jgi:hypothetical protein